MKQPLFKGIIAVAFVLGSAGCQQGGNDATGGEAKGRIDPNAITGAVEGNNTRPESGEIEPSMTKEQFISDLRVRSASYDKRLEMLRKDISDPVQQKALDGLALRVADAKSSIEQYISRTPSEWRANGQELLDKLNLVEEEFVQVGQEVYEAEENQE